MTKILFICHGNICRSVMAQCVLQDMVNRRGLARQYLIDSAAVSREELGSGIYQPARRKLMQMNVPVLAHTARLITPEDYRRFDLLIGMDEENRRRMLQIFGGDPQKKCFLLLEFAGKTRAIADPWYSGDFDAAFGDIAEGCKALLEKEEKEHG